MIKVFVLDKNLTPQNPVHPAVARILISEGKAQIHRAQPFCIRLGVVSKTASHGLQLKLDPGSRTTGIALVNHQSGEVVWGAELIHHGQLIKKKLEKRAAQRKARRDRKTRYRSVRFLNRTKPKGWLPPSLIHRIFNIMTWVRRMQKLTNITGISLELVKFDTQAMQNSEISGMLYQQGELAGYEMREYLLEKFNRTCIYCGASNVPLQVEHVVPKAKGGSNRISNLTLACDTCNKAKGVLSLEEFLNDKPALLKKIKEQLKTSLKDAAVVNATRWELWRQLAAVGLPVQCGSGALTKFNRTRQGLPKAHWLDAACVGRDTPALKPLRITPLYIKSYGRGSRQICQTDAFGFPKTFKVKDKVKFGFRTGDWVKAIVPLGKRQGSHIGRLIARATPQFCVGKSDGIHPKYCLILQRNDGYEYNYAA